MRFQDLSIKSKLILLQLLVVFIVLALYSGFTILQDARVLREAIATKLSSMAGMLGYNCVSALEFNDPDDAARTLASLDAEAQVTHAWVLVEGGRPFAAYWKPGEAPGSPPAAGDYLVERDGAMTVSRLIRSEGEAIGFIALRYDLGAYRSMLARKALISVAVLAAGMAVALVLALLTHRALTRPIHRLVETIERVSRTRDLTLRTREERCDELGVLCRGFDRMLDELYRRELERDEAVAALRESEEKYRTLVERAEDGIVIIQDGRFVYANPALVAMSGHDREALIGSPFVQHVMAGEIPKLRRYYADRMAGRPTASMYETVFRTRDGRPIHAEVNAAVIPFDGRPADLVIIRNINERKKAEEEIRQLNESLERRVEERTRELAEANAKLVELDRMKSMFLASMSHELRTPLNSILGFTGLLLMGMGGTLNEEQAKQLTMVQTSGKHLLNLINDILDISKIESGRVDLQVEAIPLAGLVEEVLTTVRPLAAAKGLELRSDVPPDLRVQSDRRRLKQVLVNLAGNAVKFSERGTVRVEGGRQGDRLTVSVSDNGIGIRLEDQASLFQPFRQLDMSSTKAYEGTGLGLYLCRKILDLLGGEIAVRSEYGHGSMFTFTLPLAWKGQ
jgi:PAS domain S-box-containing protein